MVCSLGQHLFCITYLSLRLLSHLLRAELDSVDSTGVGLPFFKVPSLARAVAPLTACHNKPRIIRPALASRDDVIDLQVFRCLAVDTPFVPGKHESGKFWVASPERFAVGTSGPFDAVHVDLLLLAIVFVPRIPPRQYRSASFFDCSVVLRIRVA